MVECFYCDNPLSKKEGLNKFCVQLDKSIAIIEATSPLYCFKCNEVFLTSEQLLESFLQMKDALGGQKKIIDKGIYS